MQWTYAKKIFAEEPWLRSCMGEHGIEDIQDEAKRERVRRRWVERCVKHIVFHPFDALDPKWRAKFSRVSIETPDDWSDACDRNMKQWMDSVNCLIRYMVLYRLDGEKQLRGDILTESNPLGANPTLADYLKQVVYRWSEAGQKEWGKPGRQVKFYLVMRIVKVSSDKFGTQYACFDLYRIPTGFRLTDDGWTVLEKA